MTTQEVATYLGVSYQRVNQLREKGDLPEPVDARPSRRKWDEATIRLWAEHNWWDTYSWRRRAEQFRLF